MDYIFFQATAINGYDATGHYLRAGLLGERVHDLRGAAGLGLLGELPAAAPARSASSAVASERGRRRSARTRCCARRRSRWRGPSASRSRRTKEKVQREKQSGKKRKRSKLTPGAPPRRCRRVAPPRRRRGRARGRRAARDDAGSRHAGAGGRCAGRPPRRHAVARRRRRTRVRACSTSCSERKRRMRGRGGGIAGNPVLIGAATVLVILVAVFLSYNANRACRSCPTYQVNAEMPSAAQLVGRQRRQDRRLARRRGHRDQARSSSTTGA